MLSGPEATDYFKAFKALSKKKQRELPQRKYTRELLTPKEMEQIKSQALQVAGKIARQKDYTNAYKEAYANAFVTACNKTTNYLYQKVFSSLPRVRNKTEANKRVSIDLSCKNHVKAFQTAFKAVAFEKVDPSEIQLKKSQLRRIECLARKEAKESAKAKLHGNRFVSYRFPSAC